LLTVLFPKLRTRHFKYAVLPTRTVTFFDTEASKYGPLSNGFWESSSLPISKPLSLSMLAWNLSASFDDDGVTGVRVTELNWFPPSVDIISRWKIRKRLWVHHYSMWDNFQYHRRRSQKNVEQIILVVHLFKAYSLIDPQILTVCHHNKFQ
jgi:hypothetical protein